MTIIQSAHDSGDSYRIDAESNSYAWPEELSGLLRNIGRLPRSLVQVLLDLLVAVIEEDVINRDRLQAEPVDQNGLAELMQQTSMSSDLGRFIQDVPSCIFEQVTCT